MMKKLHRYDNGSDTINIEPKKGQRKKYLCSNSAEPRCPSLGFNPNSPLVSEDIALEYLASILVEIYLEQQKNNE